MPGEKPVLVLCPGAWCDPQYFRLTTDILTKAGYTCLTVALPSVGSELRPKDAPPITHGLQTDAQAVRDVIIPQLDAGHNVVAVCHSYGGVVTGEAVKGLDAASRGPGTGAVIRLVYVAAIILDVGGQVWPGGIPPENEYIVDGDLCWRSPEAGDPKVWLAGCNEEQMALVASSIRSHTKKCFEDTVTYVGWRDIPSTYVRGKKDLMPDMMAIAPEGHKFEDVLEVDADHFAFCSAPVEVADAIQKASEKAVASVA
ncbi:Alpha/beta hydrolase fold-1 [Xylaria sp. FL1042]|nr:Alpha/beta hydrolase fold-1 [Xylaria sp. FL1042]